MPETLVIAIDALPALLRGVGVTVGCVVGAMLLGLIVGVPMAVAQVYGHPALKRLVSIYVWFFRGVPILVLLFLFYFGLFQLLGFNISAFTSVILVLGMTTAAYQSQIFRGSILALSRGQFRAASALGMSDAITIRTIILPQALRLSLPGWSNEYSILLKDSALVFVLGVPDIMAQARFIATRTYEHLTLNIEAALLYFILTWIGIRALRALERKVAIPGYGHT